MIIVRNNSDQCPPAIKRSEEAYDQAELFAWLAHHLGLKRRVVLGQGQHTLECTLGDLLSSRDAV